MAINEAGEKLWLRTAVDVYILYAKGQKEQLHPSRRTGWRLEHEHRSAIRRYLCMWEQLHLITALHKVMNCTVSNCPLSSVKFIRRSSRHSGSELQ